MIRLGFRPALGLPQNAPPLRERMTSISSQVVSFSVDNASFFGNFSASDCCRTKVLLLNILIINW